MHRGDPMYRIFFERNVQLSISFRTIAVGSKRWGVEVQRSHIYWGIFTYFTHGQFFYRCPDLFGNVTKIYEHRLQFERSLWENFNVNSSDVRSSKKKKKKNSLHSI